MMTGYIDFAEYYDYDHDISFDIPFYLDFANQCQSPILELACGTGRVLIPLASAGFEIYGVDLSANMLAVCQKAIDGQPFEQRINLFLADMASFDLPRKDFHLGFIALRSFMHLLTRSDQIACLQQVYQHLAPHGKFIVTAIAPDPEKLSRMPGEDFRIRREFDLPDGHHVVRKERLVKHDAASQVRLFEFKFEEFDQKGQIIRERIIPLETRYLLRPELQRLLETAGFEIIDVYEDYDKRPYEGHGEMIFIARRP